MGYELHLAKAADWARAESRFTEAEWKALQSEHPDRNWLFFSNGDISVKNPSPDQIADLVRIAGQHQWSVQGDDGETYAEDGSPIKRRQRGFWKKAKDWTTSFLRKEASPRRALDLTCPFKVGDHVHTTFRKGGVVIEIDPKGNHGHGSIKVQFPDGVVLGSMFFAHDFKKTYDPLPYRLLRGA